MKTEEENERRMWKINKLTTWLFSQFGVCVATTAAWGRIKEWDSELAEHIHELLL